MRTCRLLIGVLAALAAAAPASARMVKVHDVAGLVAAIKGAKPGDEIVLADGTYTLADKIVARAGGTPQARVVLRAEHRFKAMLRSSGEIALEIRAPDWTVRDLDIRGICADDGHCEHAVHVVGPADRFRLLDNRLVDFNAQLKVNADGSKIIPNHGLVEGNEMFDAHPRRTDGPVTPVDIDNASGWVVRANEIYDFRKALGAQISYGAFIKGGAVGGVFERNLVVCSTHRYEPGTRIGLSFGGGGMDPGLCPPHWSNDYPCDPEMQNGIIRNNIIANCSDAGIYLNHAKNSRVLFNTLIDTGGIDFRFPSSDGEARGNLSDAYVHDRDDATHTDGGNLAGVDDDVFKKLYKDARFGDLRLATDTAGLAKAGIIGKGGEDSRVADDFCGRKRVPPLDMGALQSSLGDCATVK